MADPTDRDADRLDKWLDSNGKIGGDDLTAFAGRLLREAGLPAAPAEPSRDQRERIRARVLGGAPDTEKARPTVHATTFAPNGTAPTPIPIRQPDRAAPSKLSILMTAALVALIAVAGLGLVRGSLDLPGGGDDPAPTDAPALAYSPVASPAAGVDCSRDQMVSVFAGAVPDILKDSAHATLDDGTLTWHCGGDSEELATGVRNASGVFWPGVLALVTEDDEVRLLNIASDKALDLDVGGHLLLTDTGEIDFRNGFVWSHGPEPWVTVPANADRTDWRVIDVRSMESLLLSDELGGPLPERSNPDFGQITGTDVGVITWRPTNHFQSATPVSGGGVELKSESRDLVLPGSIDQRRWIDITQYGIQSPLRSGYSQHFSVSRDGNLLAYTTVTDTFEPVIRIEQAVSGERLVDVPIGKIDLDTKFILAGDDGAYLVVANGENVRIVATAPGAVREIAELPVPGPDLLGFLPTADPDTILIANSGTSVSPINVTTGEGTESWQYVPPPWGQVFGTYELPRNLVRVVSDLGGTPSTIQLVDPATGEIVLESEPVDAHPIQIVSFTTWLRNGGEMALVPIGYNRAVVLNATTGETWQIAAPVDDDRLWHFFPSYNGRFVTARPEPPTGTTDVDDGDVYIAPLEPGAKWVPLGGTSADMSMLPPSTPAG